MIAGGIAGYVFQADPADKIAAAVRHVAQGRAFFTQEQLALTHHWRQEVSQQWHNLTEREQEILLLLTEGQSNKEIAETLTISENTVGTHIGNLLSKLNVSSRIEAVAWAWQHGLSQEIGFSGGNDQ